MQTSVRELSSYRDDFPIFSQENAPVYLDSAATSQKPQVVIDRITRYLSFENANVHRGVYQLSEVATTAFETSRSRVMKFLGAACPEEVIFTKGTTEAINLVASTWGHENIKAGDRIVLSVSEHHSNIVPWQMLAERVGAEIKFIKLRDDFRLDLEHAKELITKKTKLVAIAHVSNVLGVIHPVTKIAAMARNVGAKVLLDGAQGAVHLDVNVGTLDCDFYAFGAHKVLGPTGVGVLWGKAELLEQMPPYQGGGDMIETVTVDGSTWAGLPSKFEAGTPNISGVIGLDSALQYLMALPRPLVLEHERRLGRQAAEGLRAMGAQVFVGEGDDWVGIVSFFHPQMHPHDIASLCDQEGVCIRAGHHCAQPLMAALKIGASARLSPFLYNRELDIDQFLKAMEKAKALLLD